MMHRNWEGKNWKRYAPLMGLGFIVLMTAFVALTRLMWNWLMPELFGLPIISFFQTLGLMFLGRMLFGFGGHHRRHKRSSHWSNDWHSEGGDEQTGDKPDAPASDPA